MWGITQLQQGAQKRIIVQIPIRANIRHEKFFSGFDCNLRAAVGLGEVGGRDTVFDVPLAHKILCDEGSKLWSTTEEISSGTPKVAKYDGRRRTSAFAPVTVDPAGVPNTFDQPENLSPMIKKCRPA